MEGPSLGGHVRESRFLRLSILMNMLILPENGNVACRQRTRCNYINLLVKIELNPDYFARPLVIFRSRPVVKST